MTPENVQTVYVVIDVLAMLLPLVVFGAGIGGIFTGGASAAGTRFWCAVYAVSVAWLVLRFLSVYKGLGVVA